MGDFYFEEELKKRIRDNFLYNETEILFSGKSNIFRDEDSVEKSTKFDVLQDFDEVLFDYFYYELGYGDSEEELERYYDSGYDIFDEIVEPYINSFCDKNLKKMYENHEFSKKERDFVMYSKFIKKWRGIHDPYQSKLIGSPQRCAITDILIREKIFQDFSQDGIKKIIEILNGKKYSDIKFKKTKEHFLSLLSDTPFDQISCEELQKEIDSKVSYYFCDAINCGGYALKIDKCVFPTEQGNLSKSVSTILQRFPFVRLLGDKSLEDDEYLVIYRTYEKKLGHHFIRVDSDGTVREKDGNSEPKSFDGWYEEYKDGFEALFAVKKEHQMFDYDIPQEHGLDFNETVVEAIRQENNSFSYHNQEFCLKKNQNGDIIVISNDGEKIVADVTVKDDKYIAEIKDGMEQYVENFSGKVKPIIINGKLVNLNEFRKKDKNKCDMEEREDEER